jgi:acetyl-CoA/propionyl-CoA carboxylase biotin carboxyl carrier protein
VIAIELDGRRHELRLHSPEPPWSELARRHKERSRGLAGAGSDAVVSPMQGVVLDVNVTDGERIESGALICVVEAMKMENEITAHRDGVVTGLSVAPGQQLSHGQVICMLEDE